MNNALKSLSLTLMGLVLPSEEIAELFLNVIVALRRCALVINKATKNGGDITVKDTDFMKKTMKASREVISLIVDSATTPAQVAAGKALLDASKAVDDAHIEALRIVLARMKKENAMNSKKLSAYDFRNLCDHLLQVANVDFHSCVGDEERARNRRAAVRLAEELMGATPKRASKALEDLRRLALAAYRRRYQASVA